MSGLKIKSLRKMKPENFVKLNELLRFYDGFDGLVENQYNTIQNKLGNTLENLNDLTDKPEYITAVSG